MPVLGAIGRVQVQFLDRGADSRVSHMPVCAAFGDNAAAADTQPSPVIRQVIVPRVPGARTTSSARWDGTSRKISFSRRTCLKKRAWSSVTALGVSRSLGGLASANTCYFCRENFLVGVEAYGGLGSTAKRIEETRHFVAPIVGWHVTSRTTVKASVAFGLTDSSDRYLLRVGWSYELPTRRQR